MAIISTVFVNDEMFKLRDRLFHNCLTSVALRCALVMIDLRASTITFTRSQGTTKVPAE
jgi:hypothetical protein